MSITIIDQDTPRICEVQEIPNGQPFRYHRNYYLRLDPRGAGDLKPRDDRAYAQKLGDLQMTFFVLNTPVVRVDMEIIIR